MKNLFMFLTLICLSSATKLNRIQARKVEQNKSKVKPQVESFGFLKVSAEYIDSTNNFNPFQLDCSFRQNFSLNKRIFDFFIDYERKRSENGYSQNGKTNDSLKLTFFDKDSKASLKYGEYDENLLGIDNLKNIFFNLHFSHHILKTRVGIDIQSNHNSSISDKRNYGIYSFSVFLKKDKINMNELTLENNLEVFYDKISFADSAAGVELLTSLAYPFYENTKIVANIIAGYSRGIKVSLDVNFKTDMGDNKLEVVAKYSHSNRRWKEFFELLPENIKDLSFETMPSSEHIVGFEVKGELFFGKNLTTIVKISPSFRVNEILPEGQMITFVNNPNGNLILDSFITLIANYGLVSSKIDYNLNLSFYDRNFVPMHKFKFSLELKKENMFIRLISKYNSAFKISTLTEVNQSLSFDLESGISLESSYIIFKVINLTNSTLEYTEGFYLSKRKFELGLSLTF